MTASEATTAGRPKLSMRAGVSRKLLERKAAEKAAEAGSAEPALEDSFPVAEEGPSAVEDGRSAPEALVDEAATEKPYATPGASIPAAAALVAAAAAAPPAPLPAAAPAHPAPAPAWSAEDERHLQTLLARRKAAGYQRRGRDVSGQLMRVGDIRPNPNTVVAVIVGLVTERGSVGRAELVELMARATFPHAKARPSDPGWCQGYVAGAIRNGFLAVGDAEAPAEEASVCSSAEVSA